MKYKCPKKLIQKHIQVIEKVLAQIEEPAVDASTEPQAPEAQPPDVEAETGAV